MPNHNEAPDPIPSPSELMNRFGYEVLNNKNLAIDEIAAEDYVELDLPLGQRLGARVGKRSLRPCCFRPSRTYGTEPAPDLRPARKPDRGTCGLARQHYAVNCPLDDERALELTDRPLGKIKASD
jgi:hypothetical protein